MPERSCVHYNLNPYRQLGSTTNICVLSYLQRIHTPFLNLAQEMSPLSKLLYLYVTLSSMRESVGVRAVNRSIRWKETVLNAPITDATQRTCDGRFRQGVRLTGSMYEQGCVEYFDASLVGIQILNQHANAKSFFKCVLSNSGERWLIAEFIPRSSNQATNLKR